MSRTFTHRLRVRYGECDPQGVVFNANYLMYFDVALTELWREAIGPYSDMVGAGTDMVVAEARARYVASAGFDDELDVEVRVTRLGRTSMVTGIAVRRGADLVVEGEMRHVFVATDGSGKAEIPGRVRAALEPYLDAAPRDASAGPVRSEAPADREARGEALTRSTAAP